MEWHQVVNALYYMQGLQRTASFTWFCTCYSCIMYHSMSGACALPNGAGSGLSFTSITCNVSMKACESGRWRPAAGLACCNHYTERIKRGTRTDKNSQVKVRFGNHSLHSGGTRIASVHADYSFAPWQLERTDIEARCRSSLVTLT